MAKKKEVGKDKGAIVKKMRELKKDLQENRFMLSQKSQTVKVARRTLKKNMARQATALSVMRNSDAPLPKSEK